MYLLSAVPALHAAQGEREGRLALSRADGDAFRRHVDTVYADARTGDKEGVVPEHVEVYHVIGVRPAVIHFFRARAGDFFYGGEKDLQRRVLHRFRVQDGHYHCHSGAVVRTQGRVPGTYPVPVYIELQPVALEVKVKALVFFADHVHVRLQHDLRPVFIAGRGRHLTGQIPGFVLPHSVSALFCEALQIVAYLLFVECAVWYAADLLKPIQYFPGLQPGKDTLFHCTAPSQSISAYFALSSACISAVSYTGSTLCSCCINRPISVQPSITPCAPRSFSLRISS